MSKFDNPELMDRGDLVLEAFKLRSEIAALRAESKTIGGANTALMIDNAVLREERVATRKLLAAAQNLGLTFERGSAYISAAYIKRQEELNEAIKVLREKT
jgi:hypothetical protein